MSVQNIKDGIDGRPVAWYQEVFDIAFSDLDHVRSNERWRDDLAKGTKSHGSRTEDARDVDDEEPDSED